LFCHTVEKRKGIIEIKKKSNNFLKKLVFLKNTIVFMINKIPILTLPSYKKIKVEIASRIKNL
jgi:hypothetical protein